MSIYTVKIVGEANDVKPVINSNNIAVATKYDGMKMMEDATWDHWVKMFIFPDSAKAQYFVKNFTPGMFDYREGMLKDDYVFHIINCVYPIPDEIYADQLRMSKDYSF